MGQSVYPLPIPGRNTPPTLQQTITSTTTWTIPSGIDTVYYVAVGGGGGGGSSAAQYVLYSNPTGPGYGGGSGYIMTGSVTNLSQRAGQTINITIGAGGTSDARGGHTYIDGQLVAMGGKNGRAAFDYYSGEAKGFGASGTAAGNGAYQGSYGDGVGSNLIPTFTYPPGGGGTGSNGGAGGPAGTGPSTAGNGGNQNAGGNSGTRGGGGGGGGQPSPSGFQPGRGGGSGGSGVVYLYY